MSDDKTIGGCELNERRCSPVEDAWEEYHGAIDDGMGDPFTPVMPPAFRRGFTDGYQHGKREAGLVLQELCDAVKERLKDDPTPESRKRCFDAWILATDYLENVCGDSGLEREACKPLGQPHCVCPACA